MTPTQLREACDKAGGVYKLAALTGKTAMYLYRRLAEVDPIPISQYDALAIRQALADHEAATKEGN